MKIIEQDITLVTSGIIGHQVNCQCKMGSGVAKAISDKYPVVKSQYEQLCKQASKPFQLLGDVQLVKITNKLIIANIFGQLEYGYDGKRYTDYCALKEAFLTLAAFHTTSNDSVIYFPYKLGCDRGGGNWSIVSSMIESYFGDKAVICKLPSVLPG